jgi:hypothetical protein
MRLRLFKIVLAILLAIDAVQFYVCSPSLYAKIISNGKKNPSQSYCLSVTVTVVAGPVVPKDFDLAQNYPNPFNSSTIIEYTIPRESKVTLEVFDILGRRVAVLVDEVQQPGRHSCRWESISQASGIYIYRIRAGEYIKTQNMILIK